MANVSLTSELDDLTVSNPASLVRPSDGKPEPMEVDHLYGQAWGVRTWPSTKRKKAGAGKGRSKLPPRILPLRA